MISFREKFDLLIRRVVSDSFLHSRWLNTLSYLENCGARKISSCQHPTLVYEEMLKHAAEEFRHAFYLKTQIRRTGCMIEDYRVQNLLGGRAAYRYLHRLDFDVCRFLRNQGIPSVDIKRLAYLLVTYAIERRAEEVYPIYQKILREIRSKVQVQSILLEEQEHLRDMEFALSRISSAEILVEAAIAFEAENCKKWVEASFSEAFYP